jgi:glutaredoxin
MSGIVVYTMDGCRKCTDTKRFLSRAKIPFAEKELTEDIANKYREFATAPFVVVDEKEAWQGFDVKKLTALAEEF